ncbi:CHAT domain-containing protein [Cyanobacterium sp. Dongsha4]|uniref:CHAT domain-containing protein n=1 Tax=Cyanobacterium sp. DS4 TaxID=2878255 RepID=UPI002E8199EA|nr:CHAT domain-containing protein [Cyanobacterium sp. Dongsha4]WVL00888.1 CHAT domain-containing protein [Cyanobacterium sp. Dongsha4]
MKTVKTLLKFIKNNLSSSYRKITILFIFTLLLVLATPQSRQIIQAKAINGIEQRIKSQKMGIMEDSFRNEYEEYFGRIINTEQFNPVNVRITSSHNRQNASEIARKIAIADRLAQTTSAVMWVVPEKEYLHLVLITSRGIITVKDLYEVPFDTINRTVTDFYKQINQLETPFDLTLSQKLYQWIISPFEKEILEPEKINNILFCMGEGVRLLPFAALHDGEKFLVQKYNLSRIPAFDLINPEYKPFNNPTVLAMGASNFTDNTPLPGVLVELQEVAQKVQKKSSQNQEEILFNQEFTLANMQQRLKEKPFEIIHLATHADFKPGSPNNSYIQFWDKKLTLDKMYELPWQTPPDLLILSACNTAVGDNNSELGFTGIALQSGVKSALGSLWYVSDLGTLALITEFYEQLINQSEKNPTKVQALTKAQNLLLEDKVYFEDNRLITPEGDIYLPDNLKLKGKLDLSHPFYWSAFTLISSPW